MLGLVGPSHSVSDTYKFESTFPEQLAMTAHLGSNFVQLFESLATIVSGIFDVVLIHFVGREFGLVCR